MADGYAPALFLEVLAFWFILRWFLFWRLTLLVGWLLVLMMVVGALSTLDQHRLVWAACFAGSALLAWVLLRRWRGRPITSGFRFRVRTSPLPWRGRSAEEVAMLCERRIGIKVDAAAPATVVDKPPAHCVIALAGNGVWVLEDQSRFRRPAVGPVAACWEHNGLVSHVERSRRGERFELSWPRRGALVRGVMPAGAPADQLAGVLVADELTRP